ncbi:MAG: hypothetical protein NWR67_13400 [Saprospiraceae bacterium]|nr:hypothetical protein [Saprospiraceae bacterium]
MKKLLLLSLIISLLLFSMSCKKDDDVIVDNQETPPDKTPFQELYDQGIDKYLGVFKPISSTMVLPGVTEHIFSGTNAPICFTGNEFSMFTRDGIINKLLIFLQGGGFCSPLACEAVEEGIPLFPFGILNPADPQNPTSNFDVGYVPYCDGSGMMGDNAGGFAVHAALPLVRKLYPDVRIEVINDSGVGILSPGGMQTLIDYWNAGAFFPSSCTNCIGADGNLTDYHKYQLAQDPNIRMAYISSKQDATFAALIQGGAAAFEAQLIEASGELNAAFPDRFNCLIANGNGHTFLIRDFTFQLSTTSVRFWVNEMISESSTWNSVID